MRTNNLSVAEREGCSDSVDCRETVMKTGLVIAGTVLALAGFTSMSASAATSVTVPGTANPFLAGAGSTNYITYNGSSIDANTDTAPAESPVSFGVTGGSTISISNVVDNGEGNCPGCIGPGGS